MIRGAADDNFHVVDYDELSKEKTVEELITEIMTKMEKIAEKKKVAAEKSWSLILRSDFGLVSFETLTSPF